MANEAITVTLLGNPPGEPISMTCAEAATILKGTILKLTDPRTVVACSAEHDRFGGIAAADKLTGDGSTTIPVYTHGVFDLYASASTITAGNQVVIVGANDIKVYDTLDGEQGYVVGKALESSDAGTAETIQVLINMGAGG
jgi:hypothetical protein